MTHMITIVGLGPGHEDDITLGGLKALKRGSKIVLRTRIHGIVPFLEEQGISFDTLDDLYMASDNFEEVYRGAVKHILSLAEEDDVVLGVPGHPLIGERLTIELLKELKGSSVKVKIIPGITRGDEVVAMVQRTGEAGLNILTAAEADESSLNPRLATVITDIYNRAAASELKLRLLKTFPSDLTVYLSSRYGGGEPSCLGLRLSQLDHHKEFDHTSCLYIPEVSLRELKNYDFMHLAEIMSMLRAPEGCPWDREQSHESLKQYFIEETYEVLEAIDLKDPDKLMEELGDVLLQVVFHAEIAREHGEFDIGDVTTRVCRKMIERHTHIFGDIKVDSPEQVVDNWEALKKREKGFKSHTQVLKDIPSNLPALIRGYKVQKKAALVGFDWEQVEDAMKKVDEELKELKAVYQDGSDEEKAGELGDLLFAVVNVARFLRIHPELALTATIEKFIKRFEYIEKNASRPLEEMSLAEMDELWNRAKTVFSEGLHV